MTTLPMFPLGSTVFPRQVIPLHVFEPRYREMFAALTEEGSSGEFGIVLIDRGQEVGGGDQRTAVGTRVKIQRAEQLDDGRWAVIAAGIERLDVVEWLPDDPYPQATVASRVVIDNGGSDMGELEAEVIETINLVAQVAGITSPGTPEFSEDVLMRLDELSALSPLTEFDRQQVLEAGTTSEQMARLREALQTKQILLRAQLGRGDELG